LKISKFDNVNTLRAQLNFPSKPIFVICLNFHQQNAPKNQYLSHLSSENCEINSTKSDLLRAFQHHQEHTQIPILFTVSIFFQKRKRKNSSIINSFHTVAPNSLKPSWCTPTCQELSEDTKNTA
jgi:hypothetical protein